MSRIHVLNKVYDHFASGNKEVAYIYNNNNSILDWDYSIGEKSPSCNAMGYREFKVNCIDDMDNIK